MGGAFRPNPGVCLLEGREEEGRSFYEYNQDAFYVSPSYITTALYIHVVYLHVVYVHVVYVHVIMRDEKEGRKKQARSNEQTRLSNTAHPRQSLFKKTKNKLPRVGFEPTTLYTHVHITYYYMPTLYIHVVYVHVWLGGEVGGGTLIKIMGVVTEF